MSKPVIAVVGKGEVASTLFRNLRMADQGFLVQHSSEAGDIKADLALLAFDSWEDEGKMANFMQIFREKQIPFLRVGLRLEWGILGPLERPGHAGCTDCAEYRWLNALEESDLFRRYREDVYSPSGMNSKMLPTALRSQLGYIIDLAVHEAKSFLESRESRLFHHMAIFELHQLKLSLSRFLPKYDCPHCGIRHEDSKERAMILLADYQPMIDPQSLRVKALDQEMLEQKFFDPNLGVIAFLGTNLSNNYYADMIAGFRLDANTKEYGFGRGYSFASSKVAAITEALERMAGMRPNVRKTVVCGSYQELQADALHPKIFGEHEEELFHDPRFTFVKFDENTQYNWVWAYSLQENTPVLIPEQLAYFNLTPRPNENRFVYEISNGCAVGGTLEEAILYGIFETVERDAFLTAWYAKLPLKELDLTTIQHTGVQYLLERIESMSGFRVRAFDMTYDIGIPAVMTVAVSSKQEGLQVLCSSSAHLRPELAFEGALKELGPLLPHYQQRLKTEYATALDLLEHPERLLIMEDHAFVNGIPEARMRFDFLLDRADRTRISVLEAYADVEEKFALASGDMAQVLQKVLCRLQDVDLEVLVVNQTTPELEQVGLHAVKVLIPGLVPMTFGHSLRRVRGLDRLLEMPSRLGLRNHPLKLSELNVHPHPFP